MIPWRVLSPEREDGHSWLIEYYIACKSGEIIIGRELMMELDMLIEDIQGDRYSFELCDPHKRIRFIEEKCKHYESPYAGKPFLLVLFQKALIEALFGFKQFDEEAGRKVRRFQQLLFVVGRKNGKTPLIGAICLAEFFCGPMGIKILCASNDYEQADLMFQAINNMREESRSLERVTRKNIKGIFFGNQRQKTKKGKFSAQNKAQIKKLSARTGAKEGRNICVGAVDEVFEMKDDSLVMPIRQALSTQDEPLYIELTTEGFTNDGYLDKRMQEARAVLSGEREGGDRWLIWLYTQDSEREIWQDEKSWYKSNPGIGKIKKWSFLRGMVDEARGKPSVRAYVLAKDFNVKQNNAQAWLPAAVIENSESFEVEQFRGKWYIGGVDLSETTDLTSARAVFYDPVTRKKYSVTRYFVPEAKADAALSDINGTNPEKKDYREWARKGMVTIIPGNEIDDSYISDWFWQLYKQYGMRPYRIGYDRRDAKNLVKQLKEMFGEEVPVMVPQKTETLSNPMRVLEADLTTKDFIYHNDLCAGEINEMDVWCLENTACDTNNLGMIRPIKVQGKPNQRIDGAVTMIICYAVFGWYKNDFIKLT